MTRALIVIRDQLERERASRAIAQVPFGSRVEIKAARRSLPQNSLMWGMLTDIASQVEWYGKKLRPDDWKLMFMDGLKRELRVVPNLDGSGFVNLGRSSSDLSKDEMTGLIEMIAAFGAERGVIFKHLSSDT